MSCHFLLFIYIDEPSRKKKGTYEARRRRRRQALGSHIETPTPRPAGRLGQAGLGEVCHKKLIDDMPKVSLSSHMNGLRSPPPPNFLRYLAPHSTLLLSTAIPKVELKDKQTALLS